MRRCLGFVLVALLLVPSSAVAHASWVETNPEHNATSETLPPEAVVTLGEAPTKADVALKDPNGRVHVLDARIEGNTVRATMPERGPRGGYELSYRVVSADGHPVSGSASFTVTSGPAPATATPSPSPSQRPTGDAAQASRDFSTLAMAGGAALVALATGALFWLMRR